MFSTGFILACLAAVSLVATLCLPPKADPPDPPKPPETELMR